MCSAVFTHMLQSLGDAGSAGSLSCCLQTVSNGTAAHQHFQLSHCDCLVFLSVFASLAFASVCYCFALFSHDIAYARPKSICTACRRLNCSPQTEFALGLAPKFVCGD